MSEGAASGHRAGGARAGAAKLVALAGALGAGGALLIWATAAQEPAPQSAAPSPATAAPDEGELQAVPSPDAPRPVATASVPDAPAGSQQSRVVVSPEEAVRNGPKEPLVPREIFVEAQIAPRGSWSDEPLTPPVVSVDVGAIGADAYPRGAPTADPLAPREVKSRPGVDDPDEARRRSTPR